MTITLEREAKTQDALDTAHAQLVQAVSALVTSDDWQAMLDVAQRFHRYSPQNCLLIMMQDPNATQVAGYRKWQELGRQVRKGEKSIRILAPVVIKKPDPEKPDEAPKPRVVGFRGTSVFDIAQTEGDDLPDVSPELLMGDEPGDVWDQLAKQVAAQGFMLERGDCGRANGQTSHLERVVTVRDDLSPAQSCKTLAHELAHVIMHAADRPCRGEIEVEAESVAYLVTSELGIDSAGYTFPYVAGWAGGDVELIQRTAEHVISTARKILADVTP